MVVRVDHVRLQHRGNSFAGDLLFLISSLVGFKRIRQTQTNLWVENKITDNDLIALFVEDNIGTQELKDGPALLIIDRLGIREIGQLDEVVSALDRRGCPGPFLVMLPALLGCLFLDRVSKFGDDQPDLELLVLGKIGNEVGVKCMTWLRGDVGLPL